MPGVDTKKLIDAIERSRPYLEKFYDKSSMEFLDELVRGAPLQKTGTGSVFAGTPADVMSANFATIEAVGAMGRTAGQRIFGTIGINPLVATGMGRRIAAYTFGKIGEEKILKIVEDALRDPQKAAALIRRYKTLPDWEPSPTTKELAEQAYEDPMGLAKSGFGKAEKTLRSGLGAVSKYLSNHSLEAIKRASRFGLIPAQAEVRKLDVEEDYRRGPPFDYKDNLIRYEIENSAPEGPRGNISGPGVKRTPLKIELNTPRGQSSVQPAGLQNRQVAFNPHPASMLSKVSPVQVALEPRPASPDVRQRGQELFGPTDIVFGPTDIVSAKDGGIMSVKCKPRQIVG
jgi:hypothetical protein